MLKDPNWFLPSSYRSSDRTFLHFVCPGLRESSSCEPELPFSDLFCDPMASPRHVPRPRLENFFTRPGPPPPGKPRRVFVFSRQRHLKTWEVARSFALKYCPCVPFPLYVTIFLGWSGPESWLSFISFPIPHVVFLLSLPTIYGFTFPQPFLGSVSYAWALVSFPDRRGLCRFKTH